MFVKIELTKVQSNEEESTEESSVQSKQMYNKVIFDRYVILLFLTLVFSRSLADSLNILTESMKSLHNSITFVTAERIIIPFHFIKEC